MKRLLLIQEPGEGSRQRIEALQKQGYQVVDADSQDLYWPKYIENGQWDAILFHYSSFATIFVEFASELGSAVASRDIPVVLITTGIPLAPEKLPSSLRSARQVDEQQDVATWIPAE